MKYIIVGLGNFGASLAKTLTSQGHEVIGVDSRMEKIDTLKNDITHTVCLDATDETAVLGLPIKDTDIVVIAIGEDSGSNIMVTAVFKNLQAKRLISRAINYLHEKVLNAIGVDEIVHPEEETAERWAKKLCCKNITDSFDLNKNYSIVETIVPEYCVGKTIAEVNFRDKYNIMILTTIKQIEAKSLIGKSYNKQIVQGIALPNMLLAKDDIIVVYGANRDITNFLKQRED